MNMATNDVDDQLVNWNTILEDIIDDAEILVKDLLEGVKYVGAAGVLLVCIGITVLIYNSRLWQSDTAMIAVSLLVSGCPIAVGLFNINKYIELRSRYSKLFDTQKKFNE